MFAQSIPFTYTCLCLISHYWILVGHTHSYMVSFKLFTLILILLIVHEMLVSSYGKTT